MSQTLSQITPQSVPKSLTTDKRDGKLRLAELQEELAKLPDPAAETAKHMQFLELMKSLAELYILAERDEKRVIVRNCFSNCTVSPKNVYLEPYDWLQRGKIACPVLVGAHLRDADRTFMKLLDLLKTRSRDEDSA